MDKNITEHIDEHGYKTITVKLSTDLRQISTYNPKNRLCSKYFVTKTGKCTGPREIYWANGMLKCMEMYKNGVPCGSAKFYFENGQLMLSCMMQSTVFHGQLIEIYEGPFERYYENGQLQCKGNFNRANCLEQSPLTLWGVFFSPSNFKGTYEEYTKSGKLRKRGVYFNGEFIPLSKSAMQKTHRQQGLLKRLKESRQRTGLHIKEQVVKKKEILR